MMDETDPFLCRPFSAVIFDLDGTLIDSEDRSERVVLEFLAARGLVAEAVPDLTRFHGMTWEEIGTRLEAIFPSLSSQMSGGELRDAFHASLLADPPPLIPGAKGAVAASLSGFPTAVVTSSNRESLEYALTLLDLDVSGLLSICAEDVRRSKPDPEGFLTAAKRLGIPADRCLVFEDSVAGLAAAGAAGMSAFAIARDRIGDDRDRLKNLADRVISDFTELPKDFFSATSCQGTG